MTVSEKKKKSEVGEASAAKKLRVCDPDLRVVIKYNEGGKPAQKVYELYSQNVARLSNFFDASLSVEMKEKASGEIVFQDVMPTIFEKALNFVQSPLASRSMTVEDAVEIVEFYDKYEFVGGLELCDAILSEYIQQQDDLPTNLDLFVQAASLAMNHNLPKATLKVVAFLKADFESDPQNPFGCLPLNSNHLAMLKPFFKQKILGLPNGISYEDIDSPLFTKLYLKFRATHFMAKMMRGFELKNGAIGIVKFTGLKAQNANWTLEKTTDGWIVKRGHNSGVLWKCPCSAEMDYPRKDLGFQSISWWKGRVPSSITTEAMTTLLFRELKPAFAQLFAVYAL